MAVYTATGTRLTKDAVHQAYTDQDPLRQINQDVYEHVTYPGTTLTGRQLWARNGTVVRQSAIDRHFPAATVTGVSPSSGPAAGGTNVTLTGANLDGVTAVSFGGAAATAVTVDSPTQVRATTPAHAAGSVLVEVTDDSGAASLPNGFTYV